MKLIIVLILASIFYFSYATRIFGVFPTPSISHQVVFRSLMKELAKRGHEVIVITPDPISYTETEYSNLTQIDVHDVSYDIWRQSQNVIFSPDSAPSIYNVMTLIHKCLLKVCEAQLEDPQVRRLIQENQKFDLCIIEPISLVMLAFTERFNCSLILISSISGTLHNHDAIGNPSHPVLYPDIFSSCTGTICNFWERLNEFFAMVQNRYIHYMIILPKYEQLAAKYFVNNVKSLWEIEQGADMLFLSGYPLFSGLRPTVPGTIYMGSLHLGPVTPLPHDLQSLLDGSQYGLIYFSLGSNVKSTLLSSELRKAYVDAFRELPYTVIWKYENETFPDKPENVHIFKWLPQRSILNHSKLLLFITQGGQQSIDEAIHHKVPMVVMPVYGDQQINNKMVLKFDVGVGIDIKNLKKNTIKKAIIEVVENPRYRNNIVRLSNLINDRPQTSLEQAVWWTEYVIRNNGAKHLRSPSADAPLYVYFLLDVIGFIGLCFILTLVTLYYISKYLVHSLRSFSKNSLKFKQT